MAQVTSQTVANGSGASVRSNMNLIFGALFSSSSGATAPTTTVAGQLWFDTGSTPAVMKRRNSANDGWDKVAPGVTITDRTSGYTAVEADRYTASRCTTDLTLAFDPAATLGADWSTIVIADGGTVTLDPDGSETINGSSTATLRDGEWGIVLSNGSNLFLLAVPDASKGRDPDFFLENRQSSGVGGASLSASGTNTLTLNTEVRDTRGVVSLSSNEFTVTEDCYIEWAFPLYSVNSGATWLYNVTDTTTVAAADAMGMNFFARDAGGLAQNIAEGWGYLESGKTYRIECDVTDTEGTGAQGIAIGNGNDERYGYVKGWVV